MTRVVQLARDKARTGSHARLPPPSHTARGPQDHLRTGNMWRLLTRTAGLTSKLMQLNSRTPNPRPLPRPCVHFLSVHLGLFYEIGSLRPHQSSHSQEVESQKENSRSPRSLQNPNDVMLPAEEQALGEISQSSANGLWHLTLEHPKASSLPGSRGQLSCPPDSPGTQNPTGITHSHR